MKNKILAILLIFFLNNLIFINAYSNEQFTFDITELEILQNGDLIKGYKRGEVNNWLQAELKLKRTFFVLYKSN